MVEEVDSLLLDVSSIADEIRMCGIAAAPAKRSRTAEIARPPFSASARVEAHKFC